MSVFKVFDVGQGDCILLTPPQKCDYTNNKLFIDVGPGNRDISREVSRSEEISILLTHHHHDHIDGIRFFANSFDRVKYVYLPLYFNEITFIAKAILHLKGIRKSKDCHEFISDLQQIVDDQIYIKHLMENLKESKLRFIYEGEELCHHLSVLNPPLRPHNIYNYDKYELAHMANDLFGSEFAQDYTSYIEHDDWFSSDNEIEQEDAFWIEDDRSMAREMRHYGAALVNKFITQHIILFQKFNESSTRGNMRKIHNEFNEACHNICVVLKAKYGDHTFLLTGDASKKVYNRLTRENGDSILKAEYLKMPHHGSKNNMSRKILRAIDPKVAIISHKNGLFGKSTDPHPNHEVLEMLDDQGIQVLVTNDVVKDGITRIKKSKRNADYNHFVEMD